MSIGDVFYEKHTVEALSERTGEPSITKCEKVNAIEIFDGMTNGDVIKAVFPNIEFNDMAFTIHAVANVTSNGVKGGISYDFWKDWWNAPYKREVEE